MQNKVFGQNISQICRLFDEKEETLLYIVSKYLKSVQIKSLKPDMAIWSG